ncbi:hypothetical protein ScPMuIL_001767 [Solemya velum]
MATPYKLRCVILGHEKDVRAVVPTILPEGGILSGSRDVTARIWAPNEMDPGFHEGHLMRGHSNFISSVCVLPPDDQYPHGIILTGSNDSTILAYTLSSPEPAFKLTGHTNTVCALVGGKFGTILSGSWDMTARVWLKEKCVMTLSGHEAAVWAVAIMPTQGLMLTGSADKTIKLWKAGKCQITFRGHDDCVRGLAVLQGQEFLSCSNDSTVRRWLTTGDCLSVCYGHQNFVYSIAALPDGQDFVSCSEDRTLRVWKGGESVQTIPHPCQSIWTVCTLANGDIVSGGSDGCVRVFTRAPERMASVEDQQAYEAEVAAATVPAQLGDIKMDELAGPEALVNPGRKDGQTKMIKRNDKVELYHWDASESEWKKIGDVVGSSQDKEQASSKTMYEGKEYDYVFNVDIQDGVPPLKLPFNITEDPWFAAQKFIEKNQLSQLFLDQVANFIVENTKGVTLGQGQPVNSDPFTGGNRYIPGSGGDNAGTTQGSNPFTSGVRNVPIPDTTQQFMPHGADPFTGGASYKPQGNTTAQTNGNIQSATNQYFPQKTYLTFDTANLDQIIAKMKTFNEMIDDSMKVAVSAIDGLQALTSGGVLTTENLATLQHLLTWPQNYSFPVLDILRIAVRLHSVNENLANVKFLEQVQSHWTEDNLPANQMLSLRTVCNLFSQTPGEQLNLAHRNKLLSAAKNCSKSTNKNVQIALATLVMNFAVPFCGKSDLEAKAEILSAASAFLRPDMDNEAIFRILVCVGTLLWNDEEVRVLADSLQIKDFLSNLQTSAVKKVSECCTLLLKIV